MELTEGGNMRIVAGKLNLHIPGAVNVFRLKAPPKLPAESAQEYYLDGEDVTEQLERLAALLRKGGWKELEFLEVVDGADIRARTTLRAVEE